MKEEIAKVAYELYERDGKQDGKAQEHWLEAERIVKNRLAEQGKAENVGKAASQSKKAAPAPGKAPVAAVAKKGPEAPKPSASATTDKEKKTARTPRSK